MNRVATKWNRGEEATDNDDRAEGEISHEKDSKAGGEKNIPASSMKWHRRSLHAGAYRVDRHRESL
ncbi:MAG: hypothetical protein Rhob2KO_44610 [Rhodopirellula baltica]